MQQAAGATGVRITNNSSVNQLAVLRHSGGKVPLLVLLADFEMTY